MKVSVLIVALCGLFTFASCDKDENNYLPESAITKVFEEKYPHAGKVEWEKKDGYEVADFHLEGNETEAWFDNQGNWLMTKTEIPFGQLPEAVRTHLKANEYKDWSIEDIDKLERSNTETIYVIEVEQGEKEAELYYTAEGALIKVTTSSNSDDHFAVEMPQAITAVINEKYPGATILEFENKQQLIEVDILHDNSYKDVSFNANNEWISTTWDITKSQVPAVVINALQASEYNTYTIDDIDLIEKPAGVFYLFELEKGNKDVKVLISAEGTIDEVWND